MNKSRAGFVAGAPGVVVALEVVGDLGGDGAGGYVVSAGEGGEEVVQGVLVGEVDDGDGGRESVLVGFLAVEEVVFAEGEVEEVAGGDAGRIVIVVLGVGGGD